MARPLLLVVFAALTLVVGEVIRPSFRCRTTSLPPTVPGCMVAWMTSAVLPPAMALRGLSASPRAIARWTLPLWLYVSVTGVIVYLMVYQIYAPAQAAAR